MEETSIRRLLRLEGLVVSTIAVFYYVLAGESWLVFALFFLAPDLSMLGYLAGPRVGAIAYNVAHAYVTPLLFILLDLVGLGSGLLAQLGVIWIAHIGFDRLLGYGLKLGSFQETHLGRIGRAE